MLIRVQGHRWLQRLSGSKNRHHPVNLKLMPIVFPYVTLPTDPLRGWGCGALSVCSGAAGAAVAPESLFRGGFPNAYSR